MKQIIPGIFLVIGVSGGAGAQTIDEIKVDAGLSWEMVACAAMYNMVDRMVADGGAPMTAVVGGGELLGMGAAMVRNSAMAEEIDIAVDTAAGHVARTTTLMTGVYLADPAAFPGVVGLPGSMALCDRYAAQVNEMMGAPSE